MDLVADVHHLADGLMAEDCSRLHLGEVSAQNVQVAAADGGRVDAYDRVGRAFSIEGSRIVSQEVCWGPW